MSGNNINPFPGIRPFREDDSPFFFGRDQLIRELQAKLANNRFVSVVGLSGCGKSSLMNAGLLPTLKKNHWRIVLTRPLNDPIARLAEALKQIEFQIDHSRSAGAPADTGPDEQITEEELRSIWEKTIQRTLNSTSQGIIDTYEQSKSDKKLLIIVDQFEEIFKYKSTGAAERDHAIKFVNLLIEAARQKEFPIHVIFVMRSDFLGNCSEFKGLPEMINTGQFLIPRLTRDQHREAIVEPLARQGVSIAGNVISQLLNDIEDDPDQLPILQHALMSTYEVWKEDAHRQPVVTIDHYNKAGGMKGSIDAHCNRIFEEVKEKGFTTQTKVIFQRLTEINLEGCEIRSPATVLTLATLTSLDLDSICIILDAFRSDGRNFLVPPESKKLHLHSTIDLSHECVMRKWVLLKNWITEEEQDKRDLARLVIHHRNFKDGERGYLSGLTLTNYLGWNRFKTAAETTVRYWASRYTSEFNEAIQFVVASRNNSLRLRRKKMILRRLSIGVPIVLIIGLTIVYAYVIKAEVEVKSDGLEARENSLKNREAELSDEAQKLNTRADSLRRVIDAARLEKAAKLANDLRTWETAAQTLTAENLVLRENRAQLERRIDSIEHVLEALHTTTRVMRGRSPETSKQQVNLDSITSAFTNEIAKINSMHERTLEKITAEFADSTRRMEKSISTEKQLRSYFADLFTEQVRKNKELLNELEQKFEAQMQDPAFRQALATEIRKYIDDARNRFSDGVLTPLSADHKIYLYAMHGNGEQKMKEFEKMLQAAGFAGEIHTKTMNNGYFSRSGITMLAKDDAARHLLKTFISKSKFSKSAFSERDPRSWIIQQPGKRETVLILDY